TRSKRDCSSDVCSSDLTLQEIVKKTGVSKNIIIKFIKNKRLRTSQFPRLAYPCEQCGTDIVTGKICEDCTQAFMQDLESYQSKEIGRASCRGRSTMAKE